MLDLSALMQGKQALLSMLGDKASPDGLLADATGEANDIASFAALLANQLSAEDAGLPRMELKDVQLNPEAQLGPEQMNAEAQLDPDMQNDPTAENAGIGAIASLFLGQSVAANAKGLDGKPALAKVDNSKTQPINTDVAFKDGAAASDTAISSTQDEKALLDGTQAKRSDLLSDLADKRISDQQNKKLDLSALDAAKAGKEANQIAKSDIQLKPAEVALEQRVAAAKQPEPSTPAVQMVQTLQAAEGGLAKAVGESPSSTYINTPFSNPNWAQAVQQKVLFMVGAADKSATLTLNPPELGPLKVHVQMDSQSVDTTFIAENAEVRQALQDSLPALKERMLENGVQLGQTNIGNQAQSEQFLQQSLKQGRDGGQTASLAHEQSAGHETTAETRPNPVREMGNGLVDTFV